MNKSSVLKGIAWLVGLAGLLAVGAVIAVMSTTCVHAPGVSTFSSSSDVEVVSWQGQSEARRDRWYYLEQPDSVCANGTSAGLGLNVGSSQRELVVYLSGGGACWDSASCSYFQTAANIDANYDADQLSAELDPLVDAGLFDRRADVNYFKTASYAYLPYCTADLHTGRKTTSYDRIGGGPTIHHRGGDNIDRYLETLATLFPEAETIWLIGISAGGYGATWHFERVVQDFPDAEVHLFTDASPWLPLDDERLDQWKTNWGLQAPEGCPRCADEPDYLPTYLANAYPDSRFALSVFERDPVLSAYLGVLPRTVDQSVEEFVDERFSHPNTRAFIARGTDHETLLSLDENVRSKDGDELSYFLWRWIDGW